MINQESTENPRKSGRPLTYEEKWMILHIFNSLRNAKKNKAEIIIDDIYSLTSEYTGVSRTTVAKIAKSYKNTGNVPNFSSPGNHNQATAIPRTIEGKIREFIFEQHRTSSICNTTHIKAFLEKEFHLDIQSRTIQRHLNRMDFLWLRSKNKPRSLRESDKIRQQRHDYLYEIRLNNALSEDERYHPIYIDESFLHHHHSAAFSWFYERDFLDRPSGKGRRWCFSHAISETGLINGAFFIFEAKNSTGDYHQQFDFKRFRQWFEHQLLPNIPNHSLIILDQCPFHMVTQDHIEPSKMKKDELRKWLDNHHHTCEDKWLRAKLVQEVNKYRDKTTTIEILAKSNGHKLLFLPIHHPELNPIELVWATAKNYCAKMYSNTTTFKEQRYNLEKSLHNDITQEYCIKAYQHVHKNEINYWETDLLIDDDIDHETGAY